MDTEKRKFLAVGLSSALGIGTIVASRYLGWLPFLGEDSSNAPETTTASDAKPQSQIKGTIPLYLTYCHDWFNVAVWHAIANGYLERGDLEDLEVNQYDAHQDFAPAARCAKEQHLLVQKARHLNEEGLEKLFEVERKCIAKNIRMLTFNSLGAYEGLFRKFKWFFPEDHPFANQSHSKLYADKLTWGIKNDARAVYCDQSGLLRVVLADQIPSGVRDSVRFDYVQQPVSNSPPTTKNYIVTVDPDFFSLWPIESARLPQFDKLIEWYKTKLGVDISKAWYNKLADNEFKNRDQTMQNFVKNNLREDAPPKLLHACESPAYCPEEHAKHLIQSLFNSVSQRYPGYQIKLIDLRSVEIGMDIESRILWQG